MHRRCLLVALSAFLFACSPAPTGAGDGGAPGETVRAVHIADAAGIPLPATMRVGALGALFFTVVTEDASGALHVLDPDGDRQATWGSTNPGVADASRLRGSTQVQLNHNGEARIIAWLDGFRDTVTLEIEQVAVSGRVVADTIVTLSADARDLSGAPSAYHGFRYAAVRVDANGYAVATSEQLSFGAGEADLFDVVVETREDTIAVLGRRAGTGRLITRLGDAADTVPVQVADAYRVIRLVETPSGALRTLPDTVRIPAGTAVVFQNETRRAVIVGGYGADRVEWLAGPLQPNGRQAQLFTKPGIQPFEWSGGRGAVIITP
jgi:hypothetical protein